MQNEHFYYEVVAKQVFRFCRESDIDRLGELEEICFEDPWSVQMLMEEYRHPQGVYFVAEINGEVQGYAGLWIWELLKEAHISNVAVAPSCRGQGIGQYLMLGIMTLAEMKAANNMTLEVRESNLPAQKLYAGLGFISAGKRPRYYANGEDALIMWNHDVSATLQKYIEGDVKYAKMHEIMYKTLHDSPEA